MDRWTNKCRSVLYPMVGVILISSLWVMASGKAQADRLENQYARPLPMPMPVPDNLNVAAVAPVDRAQRDGQ